jgi:hypothetical protein
MKLQELVDSRYKEPTATVKIAGQKTRNLVSIDVSYSLSDAITTANVTTVSKPDVNPEDIVKIYQGYDGKEQAVFTGLIDSLQKDEVAGTYTIQCRDMLKKALDTFLVQEVAFGIDVEKGEYYYSTYTGNSGGEFTVHKYASLSALNASHPETVDNYSIEGVKAHAVVQWLLIMSGLREGEQIQVDDTNFWIGDIQPAKFHLTSVYDAISQICELIGWYTFCDVGGVVRFKKRPRKPSGYSAWSYNTSTKQNINAISYTRTNTDLRNYVEVHGASGIKVVMRASSPYLGTTPYRGVLIANELIDTSGIAEFTATRVLRDLNRLRETIQLEADGNPYLFPGQSITVKSAVANGVFLVESVSSNVSVDGYKSSISGSVYPSDSDDELEEEDPSIVAAFTTGTVVSIGDPVIIAELDGSSSYSNRGPLSTWEWSFSHDANQNIIKSSPTNWAYFDYAQITGGNSVNVTLVVRDSLNNYATVTSGITLSGLLQDQPLLYRHLYAALTTRAVGSMDGGESWNTVHIPAISCSASVLDGEGNNATTGYALFGGSDGNIYRTEDVCATAQIVFSPGGYVNHVHIPENNAILALASTSDGDVYRSEDMGKSWDLLRSFDEPVIQAEFGYRNTDYITVLTSGGAPGAYVSGDAGRSWTKLVDFGPKNMTWYTAGATTPYWAHTSGIVASRPQPDPLVFSGGVAPLITAATVALEDDSGVMAVDSAGQHWAAYSGGAMTATQSNPSNHTRHMVRDGEIPPLVYYATQEGVYKSLDGNKSILPLLTYSGESWPTSPLGSLESHGWGEMVSYGPLAPIIPPTIGRLVLQGNQINDVTVLSGYTLSGVPVYDDSAQRSGLFVAVGSGTSLCAITYSSSLSTSRVAQAGPSYLVAISEWNSGDTGSETPDFSNEVRSRLSNVVSVVDFTAVATSGARFYPHLRPVGYFPAFTESESGDYKYEIRSVRLSTRKNLGNSDRIRLITTVYRSINAGFGLYVGDENYYESVEATPAQIQSASILTTRPHVSRLGWGGGVYYGEQNATSGPAPSDAVVMSYHGGHPSSRTLARILAEPQETGEVTFTSIGSYEGDDSVANRWTQLQKMVSRWRTLVRLVDGSYAVIVGQRIGDEDGLDPVTAPEAIVDIAVSCAVKSDLIAASSNSLYRIGGYGSGEAELIWEVPEGVVTAGLTAGIVAISVTTDRTFKRDYITVAVCTEDLGFSGRTYRVYCSVDNGVTWGEYGPYTAGSLGVLERAWWVDA